MILVNTSEIPEQRHEVIGLVKGAIVQSAAKDILSKWQSFIGGEMKNYTKMFTEARCTATKRMIEEAENLNADAVFNVTCSGTQIMPGAVEIIVYGTAVKLYDVYREERRLSHYPREKSK
jgi:uncharacterized protein YbjQ (UPF0145 family)